MLFNSLEFFIFIVPVLALFHLACVFRLAKGAVALLSIASIAFYVWWDYRFIPVLFFSIVVNYLLGELLARHRTKIGLFCAVSFNLGLLAFFKYADFLLEV